MSVSTNLIAILGWYFLLLLLIQLLVLNKNLVSFCWKAHHMRRTFVILLACSELAYFVTLGLYYYTLELKKQEIGERLMAIASTTVIEIDSNDLGKFKKAGDMRKIEYQRIFDSLNRIRKSNSIIKWIYIIRPTEQKDIWEFVVDADSNFIEPSLSDNNNDGLLNSSELNVWPGYRYFNNNEFKFAIKDSYFSYQFYGDQWGTYISGYAPIRDQTGRGIAFLGIDADAAYVYSLQKESYKLPVLFSGLLAIILFAYFMSIKFQAIEQK